MKSIRNIFSPNKEVDNQEFHDSNTDNAPLEMAIEDNSEEMARIGKKLAKLARIYTITTLVIRVLTIFLGAFIATRAVASQIVGSSNIGNVIVYTTVGLLIATLTGLETAFKWENRSVELKSLVAACRATVRKTESDMAKLRTSFNIYNDTRAQKALNDILDNLNKTMTDVETKASSSGEDVTIYRATRTGRRNERYERESPERKPRNWLERRERRARRAWQRLSEKLERRERRGDERERGQ